MKRIIFLIIATILVLGLVLPGCAEGEGEINYITIGVAGPMGNVQGVHMLQGAQMAADEINAAGGANVSGTIYQIKIVSRDTDEINNPANARSATQYLITNKGAQFIIGGFRTEAVSDVIQNVILQNATMRPYFITGAATYSLLATAPYYPYSANYTGYKYIFRCTPFNDIFLVNNIFLMFSMAARKIQTDLGMNWTPIGSPPYANWTDKVRVAILAESLTWATAMIASAKAVIGGYGYYFGWELATNVTGHSDGVWLVSDKESEVNLTTYLNQIKDAHAHIIFTILSGPVGVTYGKLHGQLDVPAVSVGINVEGQDPGYWVKTQYSTTPAAYGAQYEIGMGTWAPGVAVTSETLPFLSRYDTAWGNFPIYTAASYDMVYSIKMACVAKGSTSKDDVSAWLEDINNARVTSTGHIGYYPVWDGSTMGWYYTASNPAGSYLPALNNTELAPYYNASWRATLGVPGGYNFTMPPFTTHDLVYGPRTNDSDPLTGWTIGIAVQWQNVSGAGTQVGVWPKAGFDIPETAVGLKLQTTLSRLVSGLNWSNTVEFPGTVLFSIPAAWETTWLTPGY